MLPSTSEWLIIFGVALLVFGPKKLPQLGGAIGASIRNFKKGMNGLDGEEGEDKDKKIAKTGEEEKAKITGSQGQT